MGVTFISCDKSKTCDCKTVVKYDKADDFFSDMDSDIAQTVTIDKGECSDLSEASTSNMMGMVITTTTTCVEK